MATSTKQTKGKTKGAGVRGRTDISIVQNVILIWLDSNIDNDNTDSQNTIIQLRHAVNDVNTFTDGDQCIQFINTITNNKACMIISGSLGQHIVPRIHDMFQIDSIFIFCGNKKHHEEWTKKWPKIKGVFIEIKSICEALKQASQQCEQNAISISFMPKNDDASSKNLDRLDPMFMYTQIMKEILLTIKFDQKHINQFINYCRNVFDGNEKELKTIDKLKHEYRDQTPIWWYTYEGFLYPMLNRALRTTDVDIIIKMGFFIGDLHQHIDQLHKEQFGGHQVDKIFTVYRGQGLLKTDFDTLKNTKDGLLSFNNFLSTSKDRNISLSFARNALTDPNSMGILFVMTIDPSKSTTPFASINGVSFFEDKEDEVLFSMHTIFRIGNIQSKDENHRLFQVELTLTGENDEDLRVLTDHIRRETFPNDKGWYRLGLVLRKMGRFDMSQQVYEALLDQTTNESEKAPIYHQIAMAKYNQQEYEDALIFYEKSLEVKQKTLPPNHLDFAYTYNNIGEVYRKISVYPKALASYEKALKIQQQSLSPNHPDLAMTYNNIGSVHGQMGEHAKAVLYFKKTLEIQQQSLPPNHPHLASTYNNIGLFYEKMSDYSKARSFYERTVDIAERSLPPNHPNLQIYRNNLKEVIKKL